jgi:diguanylate cyclase (GGDEF)-like protein
MVLTAKPDEQLAHVLVVDDDKNMRKLLRLALERDGYQVTTACDGVQALSLYRHESPDVVLMDPEMPELDGFEACAQLRKLPGGDETPVMMITGLNDESSVDKAFESGASEYITKPFNWAVLRNRVRRLISERSAEKRVAYMAFNDALTGLPNRTLFQERLEMGLRQARRTRSELACMFLDLDGFKMVNDTLGHDIGDELLKCVAERLVTCLRESDTVARVGGDEFTAVLSNVSSRRQVERAAERVIEALREPIHLANRDLVIGASVGIAMYPEDGSDVQTLLRSADMAMYEAKDEGRNHVRFYSHAVGQSVHTRMSMESRIRAALDRDEFTVFYQPIIDVNTSRICSFEALVRWEHPEMGMVSPVKFVCLAEESGLIGPLGQTVLRKACAQACEIEEAGFDTTVSVNLSARQFSDLHLVDTLRKIFDSARVDASRIVLELTENTVMHNVERSISMLKELKDLGVQISIDDFGTGYSSLAYLKRFPLDCLKVDHSFVRLVPDSPEDAAIVSAVVALARSLQLTVVAEGVELASQVDYLRDIGCERLQGYLLGRPAPADTCLPLLRSGINVFALEGKAPPPHVLAGGALRC